MDLFNKKKIRQLEREVAMYEEAYSKAMKKLEELTVTNERLKEENKKLKLEHILSSETKYGV